MKIQQVAPSQTFCGSNPKRGARHIGQVLNKLYEAAYRDMPQQSDIIQISTKLNNGLEVTGVATFDKGKFINLSFPYEHAQYRSEFCANIIRKYNEVVTKGKAYK